MKVLIFSSQYGKSGSSIRAQLIAHGFKRLGVDVAVAGYGIPKELQSSIKSYILNPEKSGRVSLVNIAIDFSPDWVYGITEDAADWVLNAARQVDAKLAFDVHAISLFEVIELGKAYGNRVNRLKQGLHNLINISKADLLTVVPPVLYPIIKLLVGRSKVIQITGLLDTSLYPVFIDSKNNPNKKLGVFYIGNYYKWQGVDIFLDAAEKVLRKSQKYEFTILGSVGLQEENKILNHPVVRGGMVQILNTVIHDEVPKYMYQADILVLPRPLMLSSHFAFPSKLCEYMASGKSIIATDLAPHRWALANPPCGILCPTNSEGLAHALLDFDAEKGIEYGKIAREIAMSKFDYIQQCANILEAFEKRL